MVMKLLAKIFGTKHEREVKRLQPIVDSVNALEAEMRKLSDGEMQAKTAEFRRRIKQQLAHGDQEEDALNDILPEAFALVREAGRRTIKQRHFDVQLMGGVILHEGKVAEMKTGEGKTLVATLPLYLNALTGRGAHLVTTNEYLAECGSVGAGDFLGMGNIYEFLGLTVGCLKHGMETEERQATYNADVTYGTVSEFGFDYLRDNMAPHKDAQVQQKGRHFVIVDEVDNTLIDEARTPLIISGPAEEATEKYSQINNIMPRFNRDEDYTIDEKAKTATLTEKGVTKAEKLLGVDNLYEGENIELVHHVNKALVAHVIYKRDVHYVVKDNEVMIVDEFTGRLMPGRRWSDGLHQAVEAKERVKIERENQTLATITIQNYFRMYEKLSGMTGTAATEAEELGEIYKLDVAVVPTNEPMVRLDIDDAVYRSVREKDEAIIKEVKRANEKGQPVLVGTVSVERNEKMSKMLSRQGVKHEILNAKNHGREAEIISLAGQKSSVTVATNMAGRGTDIKLGEGVKEVGGLKVIGTERHEARRIDNQLRGRSGRQGDAGESRFFVSMEDDLMRIFGSERMVGMMDKLGLEDGQVIEHPWVSKAIRRAQTKVEQHNFDIRKHLLEFDDVMNRQREVVYGRRQAILDGAEQKERVQVMMEEVCEDKVASYAPAKTYPEEWNWDGLNVWLESHRLPHVILSEEDQRGMKRDVLKEELVKRFREVFDKKGDDLGAEVMRHLERQMILQELDSLWKDHLYAMDSLKEGIGLRGYGQLDPIIEYKKEGFAMFGELIVHLQENILRTLCLVQVHGEISEARHVFASKFREEKAEFDPRRYRQQQQPPPQQQQMPGGAEGYSQEDWQAAQQAGGDSPRGVTFKRDQPKVGRNDPCPCGSGKKYKKCCGAQ